MPIFVHRIQYLPFIFLQSLQIHKHISKGLDFRYVIPLTQANRYLLILTFPPHSNKRSNMFKSKSALVSLLLFVALSLLASPAFATERADLVKSTPTNAKNAERQLDGEEEEDCHDDHDHRVLAEGDEDCHHDDHSSPAASLSTAISAAIAAGAIAFSIF